MKNIFKGLLFAAVLGMAFTSCKDEAEIPGRGTPINPEKEIAATYEGTWTFVKKVDATETTTTYDGKMIVSGGNMLTPPVLNLTVPLLQPIVRRLPTVSRLQLMSINFHPELLTIIIPLMTMHSATIWI